MSRAAYRAWSIQQRKFESLPFFEQLKAENIVANPHGFRLEVADDELDSLRIAREGVMATLSKPAEDEHLHARLAHQFTRYNMRNSVRGAA